MTGEIVLFLLLAVFTLAAAAWSVVAPKVVHAALGLMTAFLGVAGIYLVLESPFLAVVQVLIYIGAIATMILFAIMLSDLPEIRGEAIPAGERGTRRAYAAVPRWLARLIPPAAGLAFLLLIRWEEVGLPALSRPGPAGAPIEIEDLARLLFNQYALPFEALSVLILSALIGALVLARKESE
ncbi:MAG: NADH-quinone oxidoreductase subunit J [Bacillota bacterium]|nr:NADH-quinone oxidoreductase subunit J [Bacillota bacterium]